MIRLTTLTKVLTKAAEEKLAALEEEFLKEVSEDPEPEEDMWSRMGINKPDYLEEEDGNPMDVRFEESDFEYKEGIALVKHSRIDLILAVGDNSEVFMESGKSFTAKHTPEEIEKLIEQHGGI